MKVFGGKREEQPHSPQSGNKKTAGGKKKRRRLLLLLALILAAVLSCCAAFHVWVKPPDISKPNTADPVDPTGQPVKEIDEGDPLYIPPDGERKADYFTFLVCAKDEVGLNTDSMMVVSFDVKNGTIDVLNLPRDTMSNVKRTGASKKLNAAYYKGIEQLKKEVQMLLGFSPDKYMVVDFEGIAAIVDAIGGVDYEIPFRMKYDAPDQNLHINLQAGYQHLNGKQVVHFLRWRQNNKGVKPSGYQTGDIGRVENQQKFLKTLAKKMMNPLNVAKAPQIAEAIYKNVKTDIDLSEMVWIGMEAMKLNGDNIEMHTLPGDGQYVYTGGITLSFWIPDEKAVLELVNENFNPFLEDITDLDIVNPNTLSAPPKKTTGKTAEKPKTTTEKPDDKEEPEEKPKPKEEPDRIELEKPDDTGGTSSEQPEEPAEPAVTPEEPETPPEPVSPQTPAEPETPSEPESPQTPAEPETPPPTDAPLDPELAP